MTYDFLAKACERHGRHTFKGITPDAEKFLESLSWTGNVRQLENAVERTVLLYDDEYIGVEHLQFLKEDSDTNEVVEKPGKNILEKNMAGIIPPDGIDLDDLITKLVGEAMDMSNGNKALAAKLLNISPRTITRRLEKVTNKNE